MLQDCLYLRASAANTLEYKYYTFSLSDKYFGLRFCSHQIVAYFEQNVMLGTEVFTEA